MLVSSVARPGRVLPPLGVAVGVLVVGLGLIAFETRRDTLAGGRWPLALLRVVVGWAWVDNAQDHFWSSQWFAGSGGQYAQVANGAVSRPSIWPLDPLYQGFLRGMVVANP